MSSQNLNSAQSLPAELWHEILNHLQAIHPGDPSIWAILSLVSRFFHQVAQARLYNTVTFSCVGSDNTHPACVALCRGLNKGKRSAESAATHVRTCIISGWRDIPAWSALYNKYLPATRKMPHLQSLVLKDVYIGPEMIDIVSSLGQLCDISLSHCQLQPDQVGAVLEVCSPKLVAFQELAGSESARFICSITASNLQTLELECVTPGVQFTDFLESTPSLVCLTLLHVVVETDSHEPYYPLKGSSLPHLQTLSCPSLLLTSFRHRIPSLRTVKLSGYVRKVGLPGTVRTQVDLATVLASPSIVDLEIPASKLSALPLVRACPNLRVLRLYMTQSFTCTESAIPTLQLLIEKWTQYPPIEELIVEFPESNMVSLLPVPSLLSLPDKDKETQAIASLCRTLSHLTRVTFPKNQTWVRASPNDDWTSRL